MTYQQLINELDRRTATGQLIASLNDDGEVGYWRAEQATERQVKNALTVAEVRMVRRTQKKHFTI